MKLKDQGKLHPISREVRNNTIAQKRNCLVVTTGKSGTGKSYINLDLASETCKRFNPVTDCVFRADEYLRRAYEEKVRVNDAVQFDDIATQEGMGNREWFSIGNKALVYTFTTQRFKRFSTWMNSLSLKLIDSHVKQFIDIWIDIKSISHKREETTFKAYKCHFSPVTEELYKQYFQIDGHRIHKFVRRWDNLNPETARLYELHSKEFKQELGESLQDQVEQQNLSNDERNRQAGRIKRQLEKMRKDILENKTESIFVKEWGGKWKLDEKMIMGTLEVGLSAGKKASSELYVKLIPFFRELNKQREEPKPEPQPSP